MQGWHLLSRSPYQDCLSIGSNDQAKQDLIVQHHQLCKQVQVLQVSCHLHTLLRLWNTDHTCWLWKKIIQAFETKCLRKHLRMSYLQNKINEWVRSKINFFLGPQEPLLATVKRRKLARFGHVTSVDSLSNTILQGTLEGGQHAMVGIGYAGWTTSKIWHACPCQNHAKFSPLNSCQKRFLWTHKEVDLAPHPVVCLVLQVGDAKKFPQVLGFESLDPVSVVISSLTLRVYVFIIFLLILAARWLASLHVQNNSALYRTLTGMLRARARKIAENQLKSSLTR